MPSLQRQVRLDQSDKEALQAAQFAEISKHVSGMVREAMSTCAKAVDALLKNTTSNSGDAKVAAEAILAARQWVTSVQSADPEFAESALAGLEIAEAKVAEVQQLLAMA